MPWQGGRRVRKVYDGAEGRTRQGREGQSRAGLGSVRQGRQERTGHGAALHGTAARQGKAGLRRGRAGPVRAGQGME